jgi:hypothetical protein
MGHGMGRHFRFLLGGMGAAVALLSFILALEMSIAVATPSDGAAAHRTAATPVNRALKGDRLPLPSATGAKTIPGTGQVERKAPTCLEAMTVPRTPFTQEVPGRCVG